MNSSVNSQIYGITKQVEEVLQAQNALLIEKSAEITDVDLAANTVTFSVRAMPRTFTEGMTAEFILVSGEDTITVPAQLGDDHAFTAQATVPLSDEIGVSAVLLTGDVRETQLINQFYGMYSDSFPWLYFHGTSLWGSGNRVPRELAVLVEPSTGYQAKAAQFRVGLFRDRTLVAWYRQLDEQPRRFQGEWPGCVFFGADEDLYLEPGHTYCLAIVVVDEYGREFVRADTPVEYDPEEDFTGYASVEDIPMISAPEDWVC